MAAVIYKTQNGVFMFGQIEVKELIVREKAEYDLDETAKLLELISNESNEAIVIPDEPVYFDKIALDLISIGRGAVLCKICNMMYVARQLKPIKIGCGGSPFDIKKEKKGGIKHLFNKRRKPPEMSGGIGYECSEGHNLLSVITWKTF